MLLRITSAFLLLTKSSKCWRTNVFISSWVKCVAIFFSFLFRAGRTFFLLTRSIHYSIGEVLVISVVQRHAPGGEKVCREPPYLKSIIPLNRGLDGHKGS